jgi:hypothetical protein
MAADKTARKSILMGEAYPNHILIQALCKKAALPCVDVRGRITGHRARSTIVSSCLMRGSRARVGTSVFSLDNRLTMDVGKQEDGARSSVAEQAHA